MSALTAQAAQATDPNVLKLIAVTVGVIIGGPVAFAVIKLAFAGGKLVEEVRGARASAERLNKTLADFAEETRRELRDHDEAILEMQVLMNGLTDGAITRRTRERRQQRSPEVRE